MSDREYSKAIYRINKVEEREGGKDLALLS